MSVSRETERNKDAGSPAGERSGNGSGSAMDAMLRQRRSDENEPAETEKEDVEDAARSDLTDAQRAGCK